MTAGAVLVRTGTAEWHRIWSVRSSWILAGVTVLAVLGFGTLVGYSTSGDPSVASPGSTAWDGGQPTGMFALFGVLALAVVTTTADHGTGGIVPTLQWSPRRGVLLAARSGVVVATTTLLGVVAVSGASVMVWVFLPEFGLPVGDGAQVLGRLAFVFASGALLGSGVGLALRSTAGGLVTVIGLVLVLPLLLAQLGYSWSTTVAEHLPGSGALFLIFGEGPSDDMTTTSASLTLVVWAVSAVAVGGWRLVRTDATG